MAQNNWKILPLDKVPREDDASRLNDLESQVLKDCPILRRISSAQRPPTIQGVIPKNHNPDFILLDSIFVEVKGHIRDPLYRTMIKEFPYWLKMRYHLVICDTSRKSREHLKKMCDKHDISYSEGASIPKWLVEKALALGPMSIDGNIIWIP